MSDFSFMRSGSSNFEEDDINQGIIDSAQSLITIFIIKAIEIGSRYCVLAKRKTVTKTDIEYALKYQAIEFINHTDIAKEIKELDAKLESLFDESSSENEGEMEDILDDEEPFTRADPEPVKDYYDQLFIKKMHHYYEYWSQWTPKNYFEEKIKQSIEHVAGI